ncbi:MAG: TetR family transcriptional regulator [Halobacteriovoraceae bacterium]|nr:TetR family transcriptional regulator [Halobacteriovoraceae bacterium]
MVNLSESHIEIVDTKTKILAVANILFARQGFDGVSIRDIAQDAEVNVASVNYHFKNKLNLFHSIFEYNYKWMQEKVASITANEGISTVNATWEIFKVFRGNGSSLINSMNLILREHLQDDEAMVDCTESYGPPGGIALLEVITKEVGEDISLEKRQWAMRMIFSVIFHVATMVNTAFVKRKMEKEKWMTIEQKEKDIKLLARAIITQLKTDS